MKRNIHIVFLFLISLFFCCSSDNSETSNQEEFREFNVDVDGQTTSFTDNFSTNLNSPYHPNYALTASIYNNTKLVIKAKDSVTHQSITLSIGHAFRNEPLTEGSYQIGIPNGKYPTTNIYYDNDDILGDNDEYYYNKNYGCHLTGNQVVGEIVISELDKENKRIKGFFSGSVFGWVYKPDTSEYIASNVELTNGDFNLPYNSKDDFEKDSDIDKGAFTAKVVHEDRDFTFLPTDGIVTGVGARHFRVLLKIDDSGDLNEIWMSVENENLGVLNIKYQNYIDGIDPDVTYSFRTDLSLDFSTISQYIYFSDFYYNSGHVTSPLPTEKNDSYITILSLNKEEKIIEGRFGIDNSARGVIISEGYFKVKYEEL